MNNSKFQFMDPELESMNFSVNPNFMEEKYSGIGMESDIDAQFLGNNKAKVSLTVSIGGKEVSQPFDIYVKMSAYFKWTDEISLDKAKKLLNINAPAVLLSYIRPIVASATNSSRYQVLNIPFIDFTKN